MPTGFSSTPPPADGCHARESSPDNSIWPLFAAIAVGITFVASIFTPWAIVWGGAMVGFTLIGWFWPSGAPEDEE